MTLINRIEVAFEISIFAIDKFIAVVGSKNDFTIELALRHRDREIFTMPNAPIHLCVTYSVALPSLGRDI